jgi:hypothetical protein
LPKCKYEYEPSSFEYIPPEIFSDCKEQPTENGEFCIFHDKNHYIEHEQEGAKRFEEKERALTKTSPWYVLATICLRSNLQIYQNGKVLHKRSTSSELHSAKKHTLRGLHSLKEVK